MSEPLLITSWSLDYAGAAAMALLKHPRADIETASQRRLPELLEGLAKRRPRPQAILVLGVGLRGDPERLAAAVATLRGLGLPITWLSVRPFPDELPGRLRQSLTLEVGAGVSLARHVASCLGVAAGPDQARILAAVEAPRLAGDGKAVAAAPRAAGDEPVAWDKLILAAASRFRRFRTPEPYHDAIRALHAGRKPGAKEQRMIAEYDENGHRELKGASPAIQDLYDLIQRVGQKDCRSVIIIGETGTGKETVARLIHGWSPRADQPFVAVNCAALPEHLIESELFGHVKGAFTGALNTHKGAFEQASGGTLFLDEIGDMPLPTQAKLLRVLQEQRVRPLGAEQELPVAVAVIAATNADLPAMLQERKFRADLYHRLNGFTLAIPPLRERPGDLQVIADDYQLRQHRPRLTPEQVGQLRCHHWPGNVRELQNVLDRAAVLDEPNFARLLPAPAQGAAAPAGDRLDAAIRRHVQAVYEREGRNKTRAAKALDISVNTLKKYLLH